jgi:DNA primase
MTIPQSFLQELTSRTDLVELVGRYVQLKKAGANYAGLCPFHDEKSPSFTVSPAKQFFHCFGCGKHGDAIGFLMEHTGVSFIEAVQDLAGNHGLTMPEIELSAQERQRQGDIKQQKTSLCSLIEKASKAYIQQLKKAPAAIAYLKKRQVTGEIAKHFALGYAPPGWRSLASVFADYSDPLLIECGLVVSSVTESDAVPSEEEKRYDRFRDRIMFPIRNVKGEFIGFGGRVMGDEKPKYLNSPETPVFSKGHELYGLFEARQAIREMGYALVTEGYMDVVALAQLGFANSVATLGTACTREHIQKLFRFTDEVVFSFDGDAAGRRAARRALEASLPFATDIRKIKFLFLPEGDDPDSFIRAQGPQAFTECVAASQPLSRFLIEVASEGCPLREAEGRALFASQAKTLWTSMPEGVLQKQVLQELAARIQLSTDQLHELWLPKAKPLAQKSKPVITPRTASRGVVRKKFAASKEERAVSLLLRHSILWDALPPHQKSLLTSLPQPLNQIVSWLERTIHEHGCLNWESLQRLLSGQAEEALIQSLMATAMMQDATVNDDLRNELQNVLHRIEIDQLKTQETQAVQNAGTDPRSLEQYRTLQAKRLMLEAALKTLGSAPL